MTAAYSSQILPPAPTTAGDGWLPRQEPVLSVQGLTLSFGGVKALAGVTFDALPGELVAVIGPNGAGKTSLFNCISGVYRPEKGELVYNGRSLIGRRPSRIAAGGVARTFQNLALFENLDVVDNLMLGRHALMRTGFLAGALWIGRARNEEVRHRRQCAEIVDFLDLGDYVGRPVGLLPYGVQKRIELGRALAAEPRLLLLDEPVAGMTRAERDEMAEWLREIRSQIKPTMLLVEHHMHFVMGVADRIVAMHFGAVIAEGTPTEVANHPEVVQAYLGAAGPDSEPSRGAGMSGENEDDENDDDEGHWGLPPDFGGGGPPPAPPGMAGPSATKSDDDHDDEGHWGPLPGTGGDDPLGPPGTPTPPTAPGPPGTPTPPGPPGTPTAPSPPGLWEPPR